MAIIPEKRSCMKVRIELYDRAQTKFIPAHTSSLAQLALSLDGRILATASKQGTLVRLWNATDGTQMQVRQVLCTIRVLLHWKLINLLISRSCTACVHTQELRRGSDPAAIHSIALSKSCEWLAVSSDKGTVHIFSLNEDLQAAQESARKAVASDSSGRNNPTSVLSVVKVLPLNVLS